MKCSFKTGLAVFIGILGSSASTSDAGVTLYAEPFDSASADILVQADPDTMVSYVDYSNFTVGATTFNLPEAPRPVAGGAATRGILMQANLTRGVPAAVNAIVSMSFSGDYRLSYDVFMNSGLDYGMITGLDGGATEQLLWGIGTDNSAPLEGRRYRTGAMGTWGWLASENGYSVEDAAIFEDGTELAELGDSVPGETAFFNSAFLNVYGLTNAAPGGQWVTVDIESLGGNVSVSYNGNEFFNQPSAATTGFAMFGYEDPFGSVSTTPDSNWGLYDNIVVTQIPEPGTSLLGTVATLLFVLRRKR